MPSKSGTTRGGSEMPPKRMMGRPAARVIAKAKAKPKAKAAAKARGGRVRKRPAAMAVVPVPDKPAGAFKRLANVEVTDLGGLGVIWLKDASYYQQAIDVVGRIKGFQLKDGKLMLDFRVSGTQSEAFLKEMSGRPDRLAEVHVCELSCPEMVTGSNYLHARLFKQVNIDDRTWFSNLEGGGLEEEGHDEMAKLRREAEAAAGEVRPPREAKEKKEKKTKGDEAPRESKKGVVDEDEPGKKSLESVFGGTALDPDPKARHALLKKARKLGKSKKKKKKKKRSSSSKGSGEGSGDSSSTTSLMLESSLFESEKRMKVIWRKYPGALTASAIGDARENLMTAAGTLWEIDKQQIPPLMTHYGRTNILPGMAPAMSQEVLTLCVAVDQLLQGRVATCSDLLCQRIKSLEAIGRGNHWQVARQLELVRAESHSITNDDEALQAARRAKEEWRLKAMTSKAPSGSGGDGNYGNNWRGKGQNQKGKDTKGQGKGRSDDHGRGGGDYKKDDKGGWSKRDQKK